MVDDNSSIIKSVESLQNIPGLNPVKRREQRKRRQSHQQSQEQNSQLPDESLEKKQSIDGFDEDPENKHTVDYRA